MHDSNNTTIDPDASIGSLVTERPLRSKVLDELGIDYCCGGRQTLRDACETGRLDLIEVVSRIERHDRESSDRRPDWADADLGGMIAHIEATHHVFVRDAVPRLTDLLGKVLEAHAARHPELHDVQRSFAALCADMEPHLLKEENVLFPLCRALAEATEAPSFDTSSIDDPIRAIESEHDAVGERLRGLRSLTDNYTVPADGCNRYRALYAGLVELEDDLHLHTHKENNLLFPMARARQAELAGH